VELAGLKSERRASDPSPTTKRPARTRGESVGCRFLGRRPGENMRCQVVNRPHDRLAAPRSVPLRAISTSAIPHTMKGSREPMSSLASASTVPRTARPNLDGLIDEILSRCR
jgi:hypothetical protein